MINNKLLTAFVALTSAFGVSQSALADTTNATCDVREKGKELYQESGACSYSQRQGNVTIELRNGEVYTLRPGNKADKYKDQKNRDVKRKIEGGDHVYNWNHRHITVSFHNSRGYDSRNYEEERGDPEAGFAAWQAEQEGNNVPEIFMGRNGEGEVAFSNNCVVYYDDRGHRTRKNDNCKSGQGRAADDAMARHRREQGW